MSVGPIVRKASGWAGLALLVAGIVVALALPARGAVAQLLLALGGVALALFLVTNWDRVRLFSRGRAARYGAVATLYTLIFLAILAVLNFLIARHDVEWDATSERLHSLSPQSQRVLTGLDGQVSVLAFFSQAHVGRRRAEDLLELFRGAAPDRVAVRMIDPITQPSLTREHKVVMNGTTLVRYGEREERIATLEEGTLLNAILEVTRSELMLICFSSGHGERDPGAGTQLGFSIAARNLERQAYLVETVVPARDHDTLDGCRVLIVADPRSEFLEAEIAALERYLEGGGALLLLLDPENDPGFLPLLAEYGIELANDQVVDPMSRAHGYSQFSPVAVDYGDHPAVADLARLRILSVFFDGRSAEVGENVKYRPEEDAVCLARTAPGTWADSTPGVALYDPEADRRGPICLGVAASFDPTKKPPIEGEPEEAREGPERRIVAWGDSDFASNTFFAMQGNGVLFLNSVNWLARRGELVSLPPRDQVPRTAVVHRPVARLIFVVCVMLFPLLVLGGGLALWGFRRRL